MHDYYCASYYNTQPNYWCYLLKTIKIQLTFCIPRRAVTLRSTTTGNC